MSGAAFADFGAESDDYLKLLGLTPQQDGGILSIRGLTLDGELAGFVAVYEPRRRFGNKVVERLAPAIDLFALAFERIAEHDARFEAVQALEELTRNIHAEYNKAVRGLKAELDEARARNGSPEGPDALRINELEQALSRVNNEMQSRSARLTAVEDQVAAAVTRLEQAHIELHAQGERARDQGKVLYEIERALDQGSDPDDILRRIRAALSARS
jgi:DNA repair exonuclease SbcCD ATPase subunit